MKQSTINVSQSMQDIARALDATIQQVTGELVPFTLIVYTPDRLNYISALGLKPPQ